MAVEIYSDRKAVVLKWDEGDYEGPVTVRCEGENGDVSETKLEQNAGYAAVTFPSDYSGGGSVTVLDSEGNVLDEGTYSV